MEEPNAVAARNYTESVDFPPPARCVFIVGNYGSGKTEVAVNLALALRARQVPVSLADLDIVNPYFRSREARALLEAHGVRVVVPPGAQSFADLPIVLPEIRGMLQLGPEGGVSLFDVGGDDAGARMLSSFHDHLPPGSYALWQVLNSRRPFTDSPAGCLRMRAAIEQASRMQVTGLVSNAHLVTETTPEVIEEGLRLAHEVAAQSGLPLVFFTAMGALADHPRVAALDAPLLRLERHMLPPWVRPAGANEDPTDLPAARPTPLGRPRRTE
jgi:hypothetical protein